MNTTIQILDKKFIPYISEAEIQEKVKLLGNILSQEYGDKQPLFIVILNGSFMFAADLCKHLSIPLEISFVKLSSYTGLSSSGNIIEAIGLTTDIKGRSIVILEDIIDSGKTLAHFLKRLEEHQPQSVAIYTLLDKPAARKYSVGITATCFEIDNLFVVGYGLDYNGYGRNLTAIYQLAPDYTG